MYCYVCLCIADSLLLGLVIIMLAAAEGGAQP